MEAQLWEVVGGSTSGGIVVRAGQSTSSKAYDARLETGARVKQVELAGDRLRYSKVSGQGPDYGWVTTRLNGKVLLEKVARSEVQQEAPKEPEVLASKVLEQLELELSGVCKPAVPRLQLPSAATAAETAAASGAPDTITVNLAEGRQEGATELSDATREWLAQAQKWLERLSPKAKVPASVRLPASAVSWEPMAAVLFALTHGQFDPERDVRDLTAAVQQPGLVSMACATSDRRRSFHRLLYENFRSQTYEPKELVVVHTGEMPSDFFQEVAQEDPRVVYRFFPVTREAPGSPRLSDERMGNPWDAVLEEDKVEEMVEYTAEDDFLEYEVHRAGWTKGLKRNLAACIANGSVIANCDEGCLYAADYLSKLHAELTKHSPGGSCPDPAAVALARWYTMAVKDQEFREVDLRQREPMWEMFGRNPTTEQPKEMYNFGFAYMYTRSAWKQQPFPDIETVATSDSSFIHHLKKFGAPVHLVSPSAAECLAACGWHRDATCGAVDVAANINYSAALSFFSFRGQEIDGTPKIFRRMLPLVKEVAAELGSRRERYLRDLVEEHGSVYVCAYCNFAVALARKAQETKEVSQRLHVIDTVAWTQTLDKERMKFECGVFQGAGGAVAEGGCETVPPGHGWLSGRVQRMAICRNCGWQLGWRYEPEANRMIWDAATKAKSWEEKDKVLRGPPSLQGPLTWALCWRHLRERRKPGEFVPEDSEKEPRRHAETEHNRGRDDVCPAGHRLRCFATGAHHKGNGGALPIFYTCDLCDQDARGNQHLWGCGTCDYDVCDECRVRRRRRA